MELIVNFFNFICDFSISLCGIRVSVKVKKMKCWNTYTIRWD